MSVAIQVSNLSKAYQLGEIGTGTLSNDLARWFAKTRGKDDPFLKIGEVNDRTKRGSSDIVWSLKDINFEIRQGDAVGIIGRNGAGKSTLLKLLSRITSPTTGEINIKGRIASLLEVGTGFHPELSGRENIFLNGAILGMRKKEIQKKFDEIVDFSGVERYVDTPVKRYSSGMYVRLAFAVAAHLESEILIVDEVLAVGDAEFQRKCLGKMGDVSKGEGRTVLFVSHQMNSVSTLCNSAILLKNGLIQTSSRDVKEVINTYLNHISYSSNHYWKANDNNERFNQYFTPLKFCLVDADGFIINRIVDNSEFLFIEITFNAAVVHPSLTYGYSVYDSDNHLIYTSLNVDAAESETHKSDVGENVVVSPFPRRFLNEGDYRIEIVSSLHHICWINELGNNDISFNIKVKGSLSDSPFWMEKRPGILAPVFKWSQGAKSLSAL